MSEKDKEILEEAANMNAGTSEEIAQDSDKQENAEPEQELSNEEKLQNELNEANEKIAALEDRNLRQMAEFDNYRKRT